MWPRRLIAIALTFVLVGCAGDAFNSPGQASMSTGQTSGGPRVSPPTLTGNWHLMLHSQRAPTEVLELMGGLAGDTDVVTGTVQIWGGCFYYDQPVSINGYYRSGVLTLSASSYAHQVKISATLDSALAIITGTYTISGTCSDGDYGTLRGMRVPNLSGVWTGKLQSWFSAPVKVSRMELKQAEYARGDGWFQITGTAQLRDTACFQDANIAGRIMGRLVILELQSTSSNELIRIVANTNDVGTQAGSGARPLTGFISSNDHFIYFGGLCDSDEGEPFFTKDAT